ncbi:MAG: MFS transporter [Clostridia bacterium]|nr:MFS transporter [Clostridia bacterium]
MEGKLQKKSLFDSRIMRSRIKSDKVKIFPEAGLGYFIGPTLALLANSILSGYLNTYMTNVMDLTVWAKTFFTLLPVVSVIFVIMGNVLVGRLMERNKTTAGKARPLILLSVPISIIALIILFVIMPFANADSGRSTQILALILLAVGYNLWFAVAYPFYYTSHSALVGLSTRNSKDRSLLATIANATALAAMGLCNMVLPFFLGILFKYQLDPSKLPVGAVPKLSDAGDILYYELNKNIVYDQAASYNAWKIFVIALAAVTLVGVIIEFLFTRERVTEEAFETNGAEEKKATPFKEQFKSCISDKFWVIMIVFFFLYQLGGMMKNVSQLYFCQAMFKGEDGLYSIETGGVYQGLISIIGAIPTALGMVIAWPLSNKIGKGKAILYGAIVSVAGGAIGFIDPSNFVIVVISFVVKALGSTPAMYLSLALLADIMDHQEAKNGFRTDGLSMMIYGAIMAGMTGIATGIMNGVMSAAGYSSTNVSSELLRTVMPWIFIGGETICFAVIAVLFAFMKVEKYSDEDHRVILERRKAAAEAAGIEWISPEDKLRIEREEAERLSEEARISELKKRCEKKGLDFEKEEAAYQEKKRLSDEKKAAKRKK